MPEIQVGATGNPLGLPEKPCRQPEHRDISAIPSVESGKPTDPINPVPKPSKPRHGYSPSTESREIAVLYKETEEPFLVNQKPY